MEKANSKNNKFQIAVFGVVDSFDLLHSAANNESAEIGGIQEFG